LFAVVLVAAALAPVVAAPPSVLPLVLTDPDSGSQRRVDADGRAVHLFFFATWCQRCLSELPRLAEIEERYGSGSYRLVVVAVSARQSAERLREFVRERRPPGTLLLDSNGSAEKALGIDRIPAHVLLDREGRVVARASALDDRFVSEVESLVARGGSTGESRP
jgi:thiol-disulfide isomerase/thioredoxin